MWRINKIEVENFRSYKGRHVVHFGQVNVLWGRIGAGKTSLLYAIEYALFGRELEVREKVAKLVDLINTEAYEARVSLELTNGSDVVKIERELNRRGGEKVIAVVNNVEYRRREAEEKLAELLDVDELLYDRLVYISHRTLEGFIYGTSQKRSVSVDKLFGIDIIDGVFKAVTSIEKLLLSQAENLRKRLGKYERYKELFRKYGGYSNIVSRLSAIVGEIAEVKKKEERLSREIEDLSKRRVSHIEKIKEYETLLLEYYKTRSELELLETEEYYVDMETLEKIRKALREVAEEFEHALAPSLLERLMSPDVETLSSAMVDTYDALETLSRDIELQKSELQKAYLQYVDKTRRLDGEVAELESALKRLERSFLRYKELQKAFSSAGEAKAMLAELRKRLEAAERKAAFSTSLKTVVSYMAEIGLATCPICGAPADREHLTHVLQELGERHGDVIREVESLREKIREVERVVEEMEILEGDVAQYLAIKSKTEGLRLEREETVNKALQAERALRQLEKKEVQLRELLNRIDRRKIAEAVSKYRRALRVRELRRRLKELEAEFRKVGLSDEILDVELRWREALYELERVSTHLAEFHREKSLLEEVVREVGEDPEVLRKRHEDIMYIFGKLQEIKSRLELVKINTRVRLLEKARNLFNDIFLSIYKYGDIVKVGADIEHRKGHYDFYAISPTGDRLGISKLSDGQRLSLAIALALALRETSQIRLGFLIFDEPIPYVDINVRTAFMDLIKSLASRYQLVIASQSREFVDMLKEVPNIKVFTIVKKDYSEARE
ncbi:MAG: AAA family ATPase [Pyrobaculum sp.]